MSYKTASAEDLSFQADDSVDMVTVAQALHWMDIEKFYAHVRRVLKPRGTLAVYGYGCVNMDHPEAHKRIDNDVSTKSYRKRNLIKLFSL